MYRLKYHIMPPKGWLNDPNGLCCYRGYYHVFFQYSPEDVRGGLKSWGHYRSRDLIHWEFLGEALKPDTPWEKHGVYSGCAYAEDGLMELFYTGNVKEEGNHDYIHSGRQANILYVSSENGVEFGDKKLLMSNKDYPKEYTCHVRDPKVFKENGVYFMALGGRRNDGSGAVLLYRSMDKLHWKYEKEYTTKTPFGYMWECPDLFFLEGRRFLSVCPQGLVAEEFRYQNIHQSGYFWVSEDGLSDFTEWDYGFDFYAPQTFFDGKRRILTGWAGTPDMEEEYNNEPTIREGWQHSLTLFRELTWREGRMYQYPVKEYEQLRKEKLAVCQNTITVPQIYDAEIWFRDAEEDKSIQFGNSLRLSFADGALELRFLDGSGSGRTVRRGRLKKFETLKIMMDTSMAELYLNSGEMVFTTRWFANTKESSTLEIKGEIGRIQAWALETATA